MPDQTFHTVMPKKLAQALMESSMQHFAVGGPVQAQNQSAIGGAITGALGGGGALAGGALGSMGSGGKGTNGIGGIFSGAAGANNQFQASAPGITTQNFSQPVGAAQMGSQATYNSQNNLAQQLMNQSVGGGPNPALNQLNQTTQQNVQNQGAMMASQRGASGNPALMARQAAMQGANTQQQAVGQAASLNAQQQLAAEQGAANVENNMGNQSLQQQSILQGAQAAQNATITTGQLGAQGINSQVAAQNSGANAGFFGNIVGGVGGGLSSMHLAHGGEVKKMASGGSVNTDYATAPAFNVPQLGQKGGGSGGVGGIGNALAYQNAIKKGMNYFKSAPEMQTDEQAQEGYLDADAQLAHGYAAPTMGPLTPAQSGYADAQNIMSGSQLPAVGGAAETGVGASAVAPEAAEATAGGADSLAEILASRGGKIKRGGIQRYDDGGEVSDTIGIQNDASAAAYIPPAQGQQKGLLTGILAKGGQIPFSQALLAGGTVPGQAKVKGDSTKNDTQPTLLSPGEEVLPRSVTMAKDAPERAAAFVRHLQQRDGKRDKPGYGRVLDAKKSLKERVTALEKCMGGRV